MLSSPRDVIAALGGISAVAKLTSRTYFATANWNRFPRFPSNTYKIMKEALEERGLTAPASLWGQQ